MIRAASPSVKLGRKLFERGELLLATIESAGTRAVTSKSTSWPPGSISIRASRAGVVILAGWHGEVANNSPITRQPVSGSVVTRPADAPDRDDQPIAGRTEDVEESRQLRRLVELAREIEIELSL
jgi:hypothetical protein